MSDFNQVPFGQVLSVDMGFEQLIQVPKLILVYELWCAVSVRQ